MLFGNQKGGTGKSTVTIHVAGAFAAAGYNVGVLDTDSQQTTAGLLSLPAHKNPKIKLLTTIEEEDTVDIVLADSAPRANEPKMFTFADRADIIVLVAKSSYVDLLSTQATYRFLSPTRPNQRFCLLLNEVDPRTRLAREVESNLKLLGLDQIKLLRSRISKREAYKMGVVEGWGAFASKAPDAVRELAMLAGELLAESSH